MIKDKTYVGQTTKQSVTYRDRVVLYDIRKGFSAATIALMIVLAIGMSAFATTSTSDVRTSTNVNIGVLTPFSLKRRYLPIPQTHPSDELRERLGIATPIPFVNTSGE